MAGLALDDLFTPPKLTSGQRVRKKDGGILSRRRGMIISCGGWFAVVQWDGAPSSRREYIPDLEVEPE